MKKFYQSLSLLLVLGTTIVNAQFTQIWSADYQHTVSPGFSNEGKKMVKDSGGNIYLVADVTSDLDPTGVVTGSTYHYTVLKKYDASGVLQASRNILVHNHLASGFTLRGAFGLEIDALDQIYVGYVSYNTITNYNISVAKYDINLVRTWISSFIPSGIEEGVDLKVSPNGTVYGLVKSTNGSDTQYHIIKPDSGLITAVPFFSFDLNVDFPSSMIVDGNDDVFVTGYQMIASIKSALTAGIKNSGTYKWKKTYNGGSVPRDDSGTKIVAGTGNELFIVGYSDRGIPNSYDAMVMKYYKTNGRLDWVLFLDDNFGFETGFFVNAYTNLSLYTASVSGNKVILDRVDSRNGVHTGRHIYQPEPAAAFNSINSVSVTDMEVSPDKNVYLSGNILASDLAGENFSAIYCAKFYPVTGRVPLANSFKMDFEIPAEGDFNNSYSSIATLPSYSTNNFYVLADMFGPYDTHTNESVKLIGYDVSSPMRITADVESNDFLNNTVNVLPNPATNFININSNMSITKVEIKDMTGKTVIQFDNFINSDKRIDISTLPSGMYLLTVYDDSSNPQISKFLKH